MKITKEGTKHLWWVGRSLECVGCGTEIELELEDINAMSEHDDTPMDVTHWSIACPTCGEDILFTRRHRT